MTLLAVDDAKGWDGTDLPNETSSVRWRLNRAGIINVYQYEDEVLDFAGGRLLLRGVNGSGKSTAMNMLLPFLLTASPGRIDAAGEQTGILKSWMLSGREDAQPLGYLWIEFDKQGESFVCGCGIKANRQTESVTTWWFTTSKRPGLDFQLVVGGQPLSADGLRAELDGDEVFGERHRRDYRRAVQRRLFGGASIDQHIKLLHIVRSPRVGDRIDVDLPAHLVEALPELSEQALADAAQPLQDLEEHRRNVTNLARTSEAITGLLEVYRAYCVEELRRRAVDGRSRLSMQMTCARDEKRKRRAVQDAGSEVDRLDGDIDEHERTVGRLRSEISALEASPAFREGSELEPLREQVGSLAEELERTSARVSGREESLRAATADLRRARTRSRGDLDALNSGLAAAAELSERCRLSSRPCGPIDLPETALADADAPETVPTGAGESDSAGLPGSADVFEPAAAFDKSPISREIDKTGGAVLTRRSDIEQVEGSLAVLETAENVLSEAETRFEAASGAAGRASAHSAEKEQLLATTRREWHDAVRGWVSETGEALRTMGLDEPEEFALAAADHAEPDSDILREQTTVRHEDRDPEGILRAGLSSACDELVLRSSEAVAAVELRLSAERAAASEAQALVDSLARRTEPETPRLGWQTDGDHCLADLIDFREHLTEAERAGFEAALESSGLLSARLADSGALELASGELLAAAAQPADSPLSDGIEAAVPDRLADRADADSVTRLLGSISSDPSSDAATVVSADGSFRVASLRGRHSKDRAEFIGPTARRQALERQRLAAGALLESATAVVQESEEELDLRRSWVEHLRGLKERLPSDAAIVKAMAEVAAAADHAEQAFAERDTAASARDEAERASTTASNEHHRIAMTLQLPRERAGLEAVREDLRELNSGLQGCRSILEALTRSVDDWRETAARRRDAVEALDVERAALSRNEVEHQRASTRLATIEDTVGADYEEVVKDRDGCRSELDRVERSLPEVRKRRDGAVGERERAKAALVVAGQERGRAEQACEQARSTFVEALATPGLLGALSKPGHAPPRPIVSESSSPEGLRQLLADVERLLEGVDSIGSDAGDHPDREGIDMPDSEIGADRERSSADARGADGSIGDAGGSSETEPTSADSVRQSLRRRRDSLGAGWDAEARQPDPSLPLVVELNGPTGRAPLAASARAVSDQHDQMAALLDHKQSEALRELLQGLIAREIAERVHGAGRLVERMNERLGTVRTAHEVGVRLRWRRSGELDPAMDSMIDLLTKLPELRTEEDESDLRRALSDYLQQARALQPDVPYRQLIAEALDYKRWHEMAVMVQRRGHQETRLGRHTPLSEGEKKLVTYLPLFAAVAASCDSIAEAAVDGRENGAGSARFVVLDDAFAKVSEDNHAKLFGLLVELDLDLIATSERLWGTHATVPELAITEVVRDARMGAILLEHYRWDGAALEQRPVS